MHSIKRFATAVVPVAAIVGFLAVSSPVTGADNAKGQSQGKAKGKGANVDKNKRGTSPKAEAAVQAHLAQQLAAYGDRHKDALALITAARIQKELGVRELKPDPAEAQKKGDAKKGEESKQGPDYTPAALIERAKQYAGGRKDLIAIADEVAKTSTRGDVVEGPGCYPRRVVRSNGSEYYRVRMAGGDPAIVTLNGDGDSDLDLIIRDENGNNVCVADAASDREVCRWRPSWTGWFRVEVRNLGVANLHTVCTN